MRKLKLREVKYLCKATQLASTNTWSSHVRIHLSDSKNPCLSIKPQTWPNSLESIHFPKEKNKKAESMLIQNFRAVLAAASFLPPESIVCIKRAIGVCPSAV